MGDSPLDYYNPLYDVHLRQYFASPHMQKHLRRMGLTHPSGNMGEDEVYARHQAMMDTMLKNRESQLVKMAELKRKLDAAEKVETCRRIRSGQSPESFRKSKPSRSLSRGPQGRNGTGSRQRRFSNSFEDKDEVVLMEQNFAPPESRRGRDAFQRLSANTKRFNYLHRMDDPTLLAYQENLRTQLDRLERFREVSFGVHSVARQPPVPHGSWFFRRRSLPSLTASAPASTLQEPLRSINNLRTRKHSSGARENLSRTSCPPPKRRDSNSRLPPIANRGKSKSAAGATKPPASAPRLPPANASRGRSVVKKETTTTVKKTMVLPAVAAGGVAAAAGVAVAITADREPSPELPPVEPTPPRDPERVPTPPGAPMELEKEEIIPTPPAEEEEEAIPSPPGSERQAPSPAFRYKRHVSEDESEPEYADSDKEEIVDQAEQIHEEHAIAEHRPDEPQVPKSPEAYEIPADEDEKAPADVLHSPEPAGEQHDSDHEQEFHYVVVKAPRTPDFIEIHSDESQEEPEAVLQHHETEAYEISAEELVRNSETEEEHLASPRQSPEVSSASPVQHHTEEADEEQHHVISPRSAEQSPSRSPDASQSHEETAAEQSPVQYPLADESVEIHEHPLESLDLVEEHRDTPRSPEVYEVPEDANVLETSSHTTEIKADEEKRDEEETSQEVDHNEEVHHQSPPTSPESLEEQSETDRAPEAFEVPVEELVPSHQLSPPKTPEEEKASAYSPPEEQIVSEAVNSSPQSPVEGEIAAYHDLEARQNVSPPKSPEAIEDQEEAPQSLEAFEVPAGELTDHHHQEESENEPPTEDDIAETPNSVVNLDVSEEVHEEPNEEGQDNLVDVEPETVVQHHTPSEAFSVAVDELVHHTQPEEEKETASQQQTLELSEDFPVEHGTSEDIRETSPLGSPAENTFGQNTEQVVITPPRSPEIGEDDEQLAGDAHHHEEVDDAAYQHSAPMSPNNEHHDVPKSPEAFDIPADELVEHHEAHVAGEQLGGAAYEIPSEVYVHDRHEDVVDHHHEEHRNSVFQVVRSSVEFEPAEIAEQLSPNDELHHHVVITTTGPSPRPPPHTDDEDERMSTDSVIIHGKEENPMTQSVYDVSPTEYEHRCTLEDEVEDEEAEDEERDKWNKGEEVVNNNNDDSPKEGSTTHSELTSSHNGNKGKESVIDEAHNVSSL